MFDPFLYPMSFPAAGSDRRVDQIVDDVADLKRTLHDTEALAKEVQRLLLLSEAMWRILQEEHGYDDEKLRGKVLQIEEARGRDGAKRALPCAKCGRPLARRLPRCMYCGAEHAVAPFEA